MRKLQVGPTPIREAIQRLACDGLVTITLFRGTVASGIDMSDLGQILETRVPVEILAAGLAAQRIEDDQVRQLHELVASYHVRGLCAQRNFVELLRDLTWRFYTLFYRRHDPHPDEGFNNYDAIVDALVARDPDL